MRFRQHATIEHLYGERIVWFLLIFTPMNGWFGKSYCTTERTSLRLQKDAALAVAAAAQVRLVPRCVSLPALRFCSCSESPQSGLRLRHLGRRLEVGHGPFV